MDGKAIGGRGKLSDSVIDKIRTYYGLMIWQNIVEGENASENQKEISVMEKSMIGIKEHDWNTLSHEK